jgi:Uma2 family endonuclease
MALPNRHLPVSVDDYLAQEEYSSVRHEYIDGQLFAMTGTTRLHNTIALNIASIFRSHLKGSGCRVYMSDVKLQVEATNSFYYPDVMIACDAYNSTSVMTNCPVLIVEVLSRSTTAIDRREKVLAYRQLPSLNEYLIVHQRKQLLELHRKDEHGSWHVLEFGRGDLLMLDAIQCSPLTLPVEAVYEDADWAPASDLEVREEAAPGWQDEEVDTLDW